MDQEKDIVGAAEVVAELAFRAAKLTEVDEGLYIGINRDGDAKVVDVREQIEEMLDHPKRKMAACRAYDVDSFVDYLKKHGEPDTEIWANLGMQSVMAVIDAHGGVGKPAGWGTHTGASRGRTRSLARKSRLTTPRRGHRFRAPQRHRRPRHGHRQEHHQVHLRRLGVDPPRPLRHLRETN